MEEKELQLESGVKKYKLRTDLGEASVAINPTDLFFIERLYSAFETLDKKQTEYENAKRGKSAKELFEVLRKYDGEMRRLIDGVFCKQVCDELYPNFSVHALSDGFPVWANLLLTMVDIVEETAGAETRRTNPRIEKYVAKYRKK